MVVRRRHLPLAAGLLLISALSAPVRALPDDHPFDHLQSLAKQLRPHVERSVGARFAKAPVVMELTAAAGLAAARVDLRPEVVRKHPHLEEEQLRTRVSALAAASLASSLARYSIALKAIVLVRTSYDRQMVRLEVPDADARHVLAAALAHEMVHAMDDRRFGLVDLRKKAGGAEAQRALSMVIEGRAVHYGRRAARAFDVPERALTGIDGDSSRRAFLRLTYENGADFIRVLEGRGGRKLAERALTESPGETHFVFHPGRWPDGKMDARPAKILARAFPDGAAEPLSELELRARYSALDGDRAAAALFAGFRGGAKALVVDTNAVVLAFADEGAAKRFDRRSRRDAPTGRHGTIVIKANGMSAGPVLEKLRGAVAAQKAR